MPEGKPPVRGFLMQLGVTDLFRANWSPIHEEWIRSLLEDQPSRRRAP
jgi:hypothetical protein